MERDAEAVAVGAEAEQFREPRRRERADVLALECERDRLVHERRRLGDGSLGGLGRQLGLDMRQGGRERAHAGQRRLRERGGELRGVDRVAGARWNDAEVTVRDDLGAARLRQRRRDAGGDVLELRPRDEHGIDGAGRRARVDELAHPSCEARPAGVPQRLLGGRAVDPQQLGGLDLVGLAADDNPHRRLQLRFAKLDARQRPVPVVGVARGHRGARPPRPGTRAQRR